MLHTVKIFVIIIVIGVDTAETLADWWAKL